MNNKRFQALLCTFLFVFSGLFLNLTSAQTATASAIPFIINDFAKAQQEALSKDKLILVKFSAKWCLPCKMMDKHVWPDPTLSTRVRKSCVAMHADYEDFDVVNLRERYQVRTLPAILFLDKSGVVLSRFESSCTATELIEEIKNLRPIEESIAQIDDVLPNGEEQVLHIDFFDKKDEPTPEKKTEKVAKADAELVEDKEPKTKLAEVQKEEEKTDSDLADSGSNTVPKKAESRAGVLLSQPVSREAMMQQRTMLK